MLPTAARTAAPIASRATAADASPLLRSLDADDAATVSLGEMMKTVSVVSSPPFTVHGGGHQPAPRAPPAARTLAQNRRTRISYVCTDDPTTLETPWIHKRVAVLARALSTLPAGSVAFERLEAQQARLTHELARRGSGTGSGSGSDTSAR